MITGLGKVRFLLRVCRWDVHLVARLYKKHFTAVLFSRLDSFLVLKGRLPESGSSRLTVGEFFPNEIFGSTSPTSKVPSSPVVAETRQTSLQLISPKLSNSHETAPMDK